MTTTPKPVRRRPNRTVIRLRRQLDEAERGWARASVDTSDLIQRNEALKKALHIAEQGNVTKSESIKVMHGTILRLNDELGSVRTSPEYRIGQFFRRLWALLTFWR